MALSDALGSQQTQELIKHNISELVMLLEMNGEWRMRDTPTGDVRKLYIYKDAGLFRVVGTESDCGTHWQIYEWTEEGRAKVEAYYDSLSKLPCGCKAHIPSGRDNAPEGFMACKYCEEYHARRVYKEAF